MKQFKIALIGLGRWGQNYLRLFRRMHDVDLVSVSGRAHQVENEGSDIKKIFKKDWREACQIPQLDGVIVATPPKTHYEIVKFALENNLATFVEKPFTLDSLQTNKLCELARDRKVLCMVNYIHLFSKGYQDLKSRLKIAGEVRQIFSESYSNGPIRAEVPVLWDWGCHDVAMCIDMLGHCPQQTTLINSISEESRVNAEILTISLGFYNGIEARCTFGNISQVKRKDLCVICDNGVFLYDGLNPGMSKQYSQVIDPDGPVLTVDQTSSLERAVREFLKYLANGNYVHRTLDLAVMVNQALAGIKYNSGKNIKE